MQTTIQFDQTFAQRLARVDLTKVMARVAAETDLAEAELARAETLYRQFLSLHNSYPEAMLVPPAIVDYVWHAHIEHTRQYMADCDMLFGHYLHHEPQDEAVTADQYESFTIPAYQKEFGESLLNARIANPALYSAMGCGGGS